MSIRVVVNRLLQNGRFLWRNFRFQRNPRNVVEEARGNDLPWGVKSESTFTNFGSSAVRNVGLQVQAHARRLFVDSILNRVTNSLAADLRRRAAKRLLFGDSAPFFALVGVSLASGTGILTKDDELEGICWEVRDAVSRFKLPKEKGDLSCFLEVEGKEIGLKNLTLGPVIAKGCSAVVHAARWNNGEDSAKSIEVSDESVESFPLAVKMMFNYDAESNAMSILRAMHRETVPAQYHISNEEISEWERSVQDRNKSLPLHSNIVEMYYVFADRVPELPGSFVLYPDALPVRINPDGSGRNMSLFLVMKRYETSLKHFLQEKRLPVRVSILLLTQLLEGIAHMNAHGVAHRDLKCDNILLDLSEGEDCPVLVITDFGCCLADKVHGLSLPYHSPDTDRGGNTALMAPEVVCAVPGPFTSINYSNADAWAAGAIAYELFGASNPFYGTAESGRLTNRTYKDDQLPPLPEEVPLLFKRLVNDLLLRNPSRRLTAELAATICQLFLWAPSSWLSTSPKIPSSAEILQWILCLTTKVLCEGRLRVPQQGGRRSYPEYQLIATFLKRVKLYEIREALYWIHYE